MTIPAIKVGNKIKFLKEVALGNSVFKANQQVVITAVRINLGYMSSTKPYILGFKHNYPGNTNVSEGKIANWSLTYNVDYVKVIYINTPPSLKGNNENTAKQLNDITTAT